METLAAQSFPPSLHGVPFDKKWELLKPTIERLYIHEHRTLPDLINSIREQYGFDANESQYKYQIKKWKFKKSISAPKKKAICQVMQQRAEVGKSSAIIRGGQEVDTKNLRRYLKTERRRAITLQAGAIPTNADISTFSGRITQSGNRIFMSWNIPYGAVGSPSAKAIDHVSPLSDVMVTTPQSPPEAQSPMTLAVKEMNAIERTRLLVQGEQVDLFRSLEGPQRITLSTWMYQFWLFAFKTAKHWGRGPEDWTASILGFDDYFQRATILTSSPKTHSASAITPAPQPTLRNDEFFDPTNKNAENIPSALCRWSIHCPNVQYERIPSPPRSPTRSFNLDDEENWPTWPSSTNLEGYTEKLSGKLESNDFSSVKVDALPIAVNHIARAARSSPAEVLREALGFSIMSRNLDLIIDLLQKAEHDTEIPGLYPLHLAATYLDGSKTCCGILDKLLLAYPAPLRKLYINELGHTVLDQLMIAILKAHTSCSPSVVDVIFKRAIRFEGEDVDICGRWDADSACIRSLLANGASHIPFEWKHMFCHTSIQTICHCIGTMFRPRWGPDINTPSGIFLRRCSHCGLKLQLLPLHTLVLVGLHLSHSGCEGENLFGVLACLLCLLSYGANPLLKAHISLQALLDSDQGIECDHEELNAAELIEKFITRLELTWSKELSTGWQVIHSTLQQSQAEWRAEPSKRRATSNETDHDDAFDAFIECTEDEMSTDGESSHEHHIPAYCPDHEDDVNFFGANKVLAPLWAAVQTELLTYRRLKEGDEWISQNFNMRSLNEGLISKGKVDVPLVQNGMMKPFCACGQFPGAVLARPVVDDVVAYYFSNLDDWNRTTFIPFPDY